LSHWAHEGNSRSMSDRLFFPLALGAAVVMIALAIVWP
jgi:hypothetical protein